MTTNLFEKENKQQSSSTVACGPVVLKVPGTKTVGTTK